MADTPTNLHALALDAIQALDFSRPGWAKQMDAIIARGHTAAALAATADRAGVPLDPKLFRGLSRAERKDIDQIVRVQRQYLKDFVAAAEGLSEAQIAARAGLYAGAVRQTYYAQRWGLDYTTRVTTRQPDLYYELQVPDQYSRQRRRHRRIN